MKATEQNAERCLRCSAPMEWRHQTWQCPRCAFKLGCCEGEPQSCPPFQPHVPAKSARAFDGGTSAASANAR